MCSRALGIQWHVNEDSFRYVNKREQIDDATAITRRHILSCVSSMYDPLGQISPIVLTGKMIFQETTRRGLDWDDLVPDDLARKWRAWQSSLQNLCNLSFSRCVVSAGFENGIAELHHFSDASAVGYGACSYLQVVAPDGRINVSLIASKGRLAPLKTITIPRLELTAAVTAVQLDILIRSSLDIECMPSTFWTDSKIVLAYICSEHKRFMLHSSGSWFAFVSPDFIGRFIMLAAWIRGVRMGYQITLNSIDWEWRRSGDEMRAFLVCLFCFPCIALDVDSCEFFTYHQTSDINAPNPKTQIIFVLSCCCLCPLHWRQV